MYTVASDLRNGIEIDVVRYKDTFSKYSCILGDACLRLYNSYYLSSPSQLDEREVKQALMQEFPEFCQYLREYSTGIYTWSAEMLLYAQYKTRGLPRAEEFAEVLTAFSDALRAKESLALLNELGMRVSFNSNKPKIIKPRFSTGEWLKDLSVFNCNLPVIMEIAKRNEGTTIIEVDTRQYLRDYLITDYMGVSEEALKNATSSNAFFIKGLTRSEELNILYLIVTNAVDCDTKFGKAYSRKRMKEVAKNFEDKRLIRQVPFESLVFQETRDKRNVIISKERAKYKELGCRSFFIDPYRVYFEVKESYSTGSSSVAEKPESGKFAIDYVTGKPFQYFNLLDGIVGEYISDVEVTKRGYFVTVPPVAIKSIRIDDGVPRVSSQWYYPIHGVLYNDNRNSAGELISKTLEPSVGHRVYLRSVPEERVLRYFDAEDRLELFDILSTKFRPKCKVPRQFAGGYKDFIVDLTCAFMLLNFCQKDYEFRNTFYDFLPETLRLKAFVEAQWLFESFKI